MNSLNADLTMLLVSRYFPKDNLSASKLSFLPCPTINYPNMLAILNAARDAGNYDFAYNFLLQISLQKGAFYEDIFRELCKTAICEGRLSAAYHLLNFAIAASDAILGYASKDLSFRLDQNEIICACCDCAEKKDFTIITDFIKGKQGKPAYAPNRSKEQILHDVEEIDKCFSETIRSWATSDRFRNMAKEALKNIKF